MLKLLRDGVLIEKEAVETTTSFGLVLPGTEDKKKADTGKVVNIGEEVQEVKVGDKVIFNKWDCEDLEWEGKKCVIVTADKILAVIE